MLKGHRGLILGESCTCSMHLLHVCVVPFMGHEFVFFSWACADVERLSHAFPANYNNYNMLHSGNMLLDFLGIARIGERLKKQSQSEQAVPQMKWMCLTADGFNREAGAKCRRSPRISLAEGLSDRNQLSFCVLGGTNEAIKPRKLYLFGSKA